MKRPLVFFSISMVMGIFVAQAVESYFFLLITLAVLIFSYAIFYKKVNFKPYIIIGALLFYALGASEYVYLEKTNSNKFNNYYGKVVTIRGFIASEADIRESKISYVVKTEEIIYRDSAQRVKGKVFLSTLKNDKDYFCSYGTEIEITGRLELAKRSTNPGGFDYRKYLSQSGISATIFANGESFKPGKDVKANILVNTGLKIKKSIVNVINKSMPPAQAGLLNGMLIGHKEGLTKEVQRNFSDSGLTHIMAVSGMNVAFIIFPLAFIFRKLRFKLEVSNVIIIFTLVLFVFVTGFSPSVGRAVIMGIIILIGQIIKRDADIYSSISVAAILLLLYNPNMLFDIGFQLSFAATLSLVLFYKKIKKLLEYKYIPEPLADIIAVTLAAQVGVLPISVYYFNKISIISVLSNVVVVPLVQVITIVGFIMAGIGQFSIAISESFGYINCALLTYILYVSRESSLLPFAVIQVVTPHILIIIIYYILAFGFLYKEKLAEYKITYKHFMAFVGVVILSTWIYNVVPGDFEAAFVDVGQGDCIFIQTPYGKNILIDGGGHNTKTSQSSNIGETVVIPFLLDYGVSKLDMVIATHAHNDHIEGLIPVLRDIKVKNFIIPETQENHEFEQLLDIAKNKNITVSTCKKGDMINIENKVNFKVLHPGVGAKSENTTLNNTSLVLKLNYKKISILLTGDIEDEAERILISENSDIKADVLKVAHHGSPGSSSAEFLERVKPSAAIINVGKNNFGHPSQKVIQRLEELGAKVFRTDLDGAVLLKSNGTKIQIVKTIQN